MADRDPRGTGQSNSDGDDDDDARANCGAVAQPPDVRLWIHSRRGAKQAAYRTTDPLVRLSYCVVVHGTTHWTQ